MGRNLSQKVQLLTGTAGGGESQLSIVIDGLIGRHNCTELRTEQLNERFEIACFVGNATCAEATESWHGLGNLLPKSKMVEGFASGVETGGDVAQSLQVICARAMQIYCGRHPK